MPHTPLIFTIGSATFDIFVKPGDQAVFSIEKPESREKWLALKYGGKVKIDEVIETFGGGASNTAVAFARLGFPTSCISKIGSEYGERVIDNLKRNNVSTDFMVITDQDKTGFSTIINALDGDRTVLGYAGANRLFKVSDLPLKELARADWIFLSHISGDSLGIHRALEHLLETHPHVKLAWNPGYEQLKEGIKKWKTLLAHTEILVVNKEEAALFSGTPYQLAGIKRDDPRCHVRTARAFLPPYADDVTEIMRTFFKTGVKTMVITDGRNGAQASDGKHLYFSPVVTHKRVDSLGAGDSFASGFTAARLWGEGLKAALVYGTLNANSVVSYYGAQRGLLTREQLQKQFSKHEICVSSTLLK